MTLLSVSHRSQNQQSDCLAACAAMVLAYLHVPVDYARLLQLLRVQAYGTAFSNLRYLEALGMSVLVQEGEPEQLATYLGMGLPPLVAVNTDALPYWEEDTDHAVVIVGFDDTHIYLNDPAFDMAPQTVSRSEFMLAWLEQDCRCGVISLQPLDLRPIETEEE